MITLSASSSDYSPTQCKGTIMDDKIIGTPFHYFPKVYIRRKRKSIKLQRQEFQEKDVFSQDDSKRLNEKEKGKTSKGIQTKQRFNRPRIMEEGKKPKNPATMRLRTITKKRKKSDKDNEDEVIVEPKTPEKQSSSKTRKKQKTRKNVVQTLNFDQENKLSCLELNRISGPNFPKGRKRKASLRRSNFHGLISAISFPMPIWKKKSRRSNRIKNLVRWVKIALSLEQEIHPQGDVSLQVQVARSTRCITSEMDSTRTKQLLTQKMNKKKETTISSITDVTLHIEDLMRPAHRVSPRQRNKIAKEIAEHLIQQIKYQKEHGLSSLADVPLHMEDALMRSASDIPTEIPDMKTKDISKLIKAMKGLKINKRVSTLIKSRQKLVSAKVDLDPETIKEWELLMVNDLPDKETEAKWKGEREMFQRRVDLFINRMHLLQGNRKFKQWKGSVVDSVVGVFLTQNVSDYLSSNAFMSVAAKFPVVASMNASEGLPYYIEEPLEVNDSIVVEKEQEKTAKRKNKKTGIMEDETVDWKSLRKMYTKEGSRDKMHADYVDWNAVRSSTQKVFATIIENRGQFDILSSRILKFLNDEANQYETVDLEWLRDAPSNLVKRYLLEINGIGLKSAECIRLLGLKHSAFPVDTNVARIVVRLGWVPLEPLPNGVQMHQLFEYPSMDSIQKYLWPRLCKLPQETLYELHYQMITFGKVFCTKVIPNCNACPMKAQCKYFASAYVSSKVLLQGLEEKTHESSDIFVDSYSQDIDTNVISSINLIEECVSPEYSDEVICLEPIVEYPSSPNSEIPELTDIEDMPCKSPYQPQTRVHEIDIDMDALKKNINDILTKGGKMLNSAEEISKALVVITPENACIPIEPPKKMKYYDRLRTEHVVYVLPDNHQLLHGFEEREHDDPCPYLLAIWQPGEMSYSFNPPKKKCNSDGSELCILKNCSHCQKILEESADTFRGTILVSFSNGRLIIDFIAEYLGLPYVPPYFKSQNVSFEKGVNFAVAGATALEQAFLESRGIHYAHTNVSLGVQLKSFRETLPNLCNSPADCIEMIGNALIIIGEIGGNDYNYGFLVGKTVEEIKELVPLVISTISSVITELISMGGKTIMVPSDFPIGCWTAFLTEYRTQNKEEYDPLTGCLKWLNEFIEHHNKKLQEELIRLQKLYPHVTIFYADYYNAMLHIFQEPTKFGFMNRPFSACCGSGGPYNYNSSGTQCGTKGVDCCIDPSKYVHWDGFHLTESAYRWIAQGLLEGPYTVPAFDWSCSGFEIKKRSSGKQNLFRAVGVM